MGGSKSNIGYIGKYINEGIEDYMVRNTNLCGGETEYSNRLEILCMIMCVTIYLVVSCLVIDIDKLDAMLTGGFGFNEVFFTYLFELMKVFLAPIPAVILFLILFSLLLKLGEKVFGYSLEDNGDIEEEEEITDESIWYGFKLKMLEEFSYPLYQQVIKRGITNWYDEGLLEIDKGVIKLLKELNSGVELPNGYLTRKYKIIKIEECDILYTTEYKELGYKGIEVNEEELTLDNVLYWYINLSKTK